MPYPNIIGNLKSALGFREEGLRAQVNKDVRGERTSLAKAALRRSLIAGAALVAYPDELRLWRRPASARAKRLVRDERFDAIWSTSPPVTCHRVAQAAKKEGGVPWIADLRDLWTQNAIYPYPRLRRRLEEGLEARTFLDVDAFTTASESLRAKLADRFPGTPPYVLRSGFDPDSLNHDQGAPTTAFTITFTGTIYAEKQDPTKIMRALRELIDEAQLDPAVVELRFYGRDQRGWLDDLIRKHRLESVARAYGPVRAAESLSRQRESQVLLALGFEDPDEPGVLPGKVYDYLAARRPILATGGTPGEEVKRLLDSTGAGRHAIAVADVKPILLDYYRQYLQTGSVAFRGDTAAIDRYSQTALTRDLVEVLEQQSGVVSPR